MRAFPRKHPTRKNLGKAARDVFVEREGCVSIAGCLGGSYLDRFKPRLYIVNKNCLLMVFLSPASSTPRWFGLKAFVILMNSFAFLKLMKRDLQELEVYAV